jgi:NAD(P)-dependent dehydrogenase (short-subunit alcohol dehydrogenase family)
MLGKVVVVTGGTSGIGQVASEKLAEMGARIVLVARDKQRGEATLKRLPGPAAHSIHYADLSSLAEVKRVAADIAAVEPHIDVLINNAGAMFSKRQLSPDGLEMTFAVNHAAYFAFTQGLRERLIASAPSRIVNTSSDAHRRAKLDFSDLQSANDYGAFKVYCRSKLCNVLFTRELARQLEGSGVTANSLHPGFVATRFADDSALFRLAKFFAISPEKGAQTIIYLASSDAVDKVSGEYFYKSRSVTPAAEAQNDEGARRLWQETVKLVGT